MVLFQITWIKTDNRQLKLKTESSLTQILNIVKLFVVTYTSHPTQMPSFDWLGSITYKRNIFHMVMLYLGGIYIEQDILYIHTHI